MPLVNYSIEDLLPHRDRMLLIQKILEGDSRAAVSSAVVKQNWPLCNGQIADPLVLIEVAAQTAGISAGLARIKACGADADKKSWMVGIKQACFHVNSLAVNDTIITRSENSYAYEGYRKIKCTSRIGPQVVGEIELQAIQAGSELLPE